MPKPYRKEKLAKEIMRQVSDIMRNELKDPGIGMLTVIRTDLSNDLTVAKVYVSVIGSDQDKKRTFQALKRAKGFIENTLLNRLSISKRIELRFLADKAMENVLQVENLLSKISDRTSDKKGSN